MYKKEKIKKALTLVEVLISSALASLLLTILVLTTININKMFYLLSKKYEVSSKSKILLSRIAEELNKNCPPSTNENPIIEVNNNQVEFYSLRIMNNSSSMPIVIRIRVISNSVNNGVVHRIEKEEIDPLNNNVIKQSSNNVFVESRYSNFRFEKVQNVAIRMYLQNIFWARGKRYEISYKVDVPINY